jgi:hypothetical protein
MPEDIITPTLSSTSTIYPNDTDVKEKNERQRLVSAQRGEGVRVWRKG